MTSLLQQVLGGLCATEKPSLPFMPEHSSPSRASTAGSSSLLQSPMGSPTQHATPFATPTPGRQKRGLTNEDSRPSAAKRLFVEPDAFETGDEYDDASNTGDEDNASNTGDEDNASETGDEYDDASETGDEYDDASETGDEYDASETGDEYDASETGFVPVPVRDPLEALSEELLACWNKFFSPDNRTDLRALFGEGADYQQEYMRRFTEEYFYNGRTRYLQDALRDAKQFLANIDIMVRRIRGEGPQTKITFHFRPMNKTHCRNLMALRRVAMDILAYLTPLEARQRAVEQALQLEEQAAQLEEQAKQLRLQAMQLRR
jgi:hypothetical protein